VERLCEEVIKLLQQSDTVLKLRPPVKVFGSVHGQYGDLMRHFATHGTLRSAGGPLDSTEQNSDIEGLDYLFLGNFVGRGKYSLETVCLLFALKLKHPEQIHILRGCMEDVRLSKVYGTRA
jgi:protein phosphatase